MELVELLRFYEQKTGASINIAVKHPAFYRCSHLKLAPDQYIHHSEFCRYFKFRDGNISCAMNKVRSLKIASLGRSFSGCCSHGIWEHAHPVMTNGSLSAVIYLGNFFVPDKTPMLPPRICQPGNITEEMKHRIFHAALFIADFIQIELERFIASGGLDGKQHDDTFYIENCKSFINCHYLDNIGLAELAELLNVNPNYLGALIRRKTGYTFRELLTFRRIEESKVYLKLNPQISVTKISRLCGFSDSNYYTTVFHRLCGMTPGEYKKH